MQPPCGFPSSLGTVFLAPVAQALGTQLAKLLAFSLLPNVSPSSSSISSASKRDPESDRFSPALPPPPVGLQLRLPTSHSTGQPDSTFTKRNSTLSFVWALGWAVSLGQAP